MYAKDWFSGLYPPLLRSFLDEKNNDAALNMDGSFQVSLSNPTPTAAPKGEVFLPKPFLEAFWRASQPGLSPTNTHRGLVESRVPRATPSKPRA